MRYQRKQIPDQLPISEISCWADGSWPGALTPAGGSRSLQLRRAAIRSGAVGASADHAPLPRTHGAGPESQGADMPLLNHDRTAPHSFASLFTGCDHTRSNRAARSSRTSRAWLLHVPISTERGSRCTGFGTRTPNLARTSLDRVVETGKSPAFRQAVMERIRPSSCAPASSKSAPGLEGLSENNSCPSRGVSEPPQTYFPVSATRLGGGRRSPSLDLSPIWLRTQKGVEEYRVGDRKAVLSGRPESR